MKVELKKVKKFNAMSRGTIAFQAELWIDGAKAGEVSNDGNGGAPRFMPHALQEQVQQAALEMGLTKSWAYESVISILLLDHDMEVEAQKVFKNNISGLNKDGRFVTLKKMSAPDLMLYRSEDPKAVALRAQLGWKEFHTSYEQVFEATKTLYAPTRAEFLKG